jgi:hypothetical protein
VHSGCEYFKDTTTTMDDLGTKLDPERVHRSPSELGDTSVRYSWQSDHLLAMSYLGRLR